MTVLIYLSVLVALLPLFSILIYVAIKGIGALNWDFFVRLPGPVGDPHAGMANAIVGTLELLLVAAAVGLPIGILAGIYLAEFGGHGFFSNSVRFLADVLSGVPSIVIGIFAYALMVLPVKHFSGWSGGVALGIMMIPVVTRTTEELIRMVPRSLREAGLALGVPRWRVTVSIVLRTAVGGLTTGAMLALARVAGETAPLLFTAFGNRYWHRSLNEPVAALTLQIYQYAISAFEDWQRQAWGAAFVLIIMVLILNILARLGTRSKFSTQQE